MQFGLRLVVEYFKGTAERTGLDHPSLSAGLRMGGSAIQFSIKARLGDGLTQLDRRLRFLSMP